MARNRNAIYRFYLMTLALFFHSPAAQAAMPSRSRGGGPTFFTWVFRAPPSFSAWKYAGGWLVHIKEDDVICTDHNESNTKRHDFTWIGLTKPEFHACSPDELHGNVTLLGARALFLTGGDLGKWIARFEPDKTLGFIGEGMYTDLLRWLYVSDCILGLDEVSYPNSTEAAKRFSRGKEQCIPSSKKNNAIPSQLVTSSGFEHPNPTQQPDERRLVNDAARNRPLFPRRETRAFRASDVSANGLEMIVVCFRLVILWYLY